MYRHLSCIPKVMFFRSKVILMFVELKNCFIFYQKVWVCMHIQNKWFTVSISIEQKSQRFEFAKLYLNNILFVATIRIRYLYWKFLSFVDKAQRKGDLKIIFQLKCSFVNQNNLDNRKLTLSNKADLLGKNSVLNNSTKCNTFACFLR